MQNTLLSTCSVSVLVLACTSLLSSEAVRAADLPIMLGQQEYRTSCASCHGEEGKGDGPVADQLTVKPANLQMISKNNNGMFPSAELYKVIDGRQVVKAHGTSEMPIWGAVYSASMQIRGGKEYPTTPQIESAINGKILSLIYYLQSIQAE